MNPQTDQLKSCFVFDMKTDASKDKRLHSLTSRHSAFVCCNSRSPASLLYIPAGHGGSSLVADGSTRKA